MSDNESNPYSAPAEIELSMAEPATGFVKEPQERMFSEGIQWITSAFYIFKLAPFQWCFTVLFVFILLMVLSFIPVLGHFLSILNPLIAGGLFWVAHRAHETQSVEMSSFFVGIRGKIGRLIGFGALCLLIGLLVLVTAALVVGVVWGVVQGGGNDLWALFAEEAWQDALVSGDWVPYELMMLGLFWVLLAMLFYLPVAMSLWFATVFIVINDLPILESMRLSWRACLSNILPFLLYSIISLIILVVALIPFGLGLFIVGPILMISIYTSYRSIFYKV